MSLSTKIEEHPAPEQVEVRQWTGEEFERLVLNSGLQVAVFDCDGTLWGGDAGYGFMAWSIEEGLVSRSTTEWMNNRYRDYCAGQVTEVEICGEMVQMYAGLREQELRTAAARYFNVFIRPRIFDEIARLIDRLRSRNVEIWAVSSTNRWVITEGVRDFGIPAHRILAADVRVADGVITSDLLDVPTDEGKAVALRRVSLAAPDAVFGNSVHDLAMLEMARHPFPVNPSPALIAAAARRGWGYFRPKAAEGTPAAVGGE
jgi:phosphoserine phosphatase